MSAQDQVYLYIPGLHDLPGYDPLIPHHSTICQKLVIKVVKRDWDDYAIAWRGIIACIILQLLSTWRMGAGWLTDDLLFVWRISFAGFFWVWATWNPAVNRLS